MNSANAGAEHAEQSASAVGSHSGISAHQNNDQTENKPVNRANSAETIQKYMEALDSGDSDAMCELACCCLNGSVSDEVLYQITENAAFRTQLNNLARNYALGLAEPDSDCEAFQIFKQAEDHNDPDILCALGRAYQFGWGTAKNVAKAIECNVRAADIGSWQAVKQLRWCKNKGAEVDSALRALFERFKGLADSGNANAQFIIGFCCYWAIGTTQDRETTVQMCQKAAANNCSNALVQLGILYQTGFGVTVNAHAAFRLYAQAASAGNREGECQVGACYENAVGVSRDLRQAALWYEKGARHGNAYAAYLLSLLYRHGSTGACDEVKALTWLRQAALGGDCVAQRAFGYVLYNPSAFCTQDRIEAAKWFRKAVEQGNVNAKYDLDQHIARMHRRALKRPNAPQKSHEMQAAPNQQKACWDYETPTCLTTSEVKRDEIAFSLAKLAAVQQESRHAAELVGELYANGVGTARNLRAAARHYNRASPISTALLFKLERCYASQQTTDECMNELEHFNVLRRIDNALRADINALLKQMQ